MPRTKTVAISSAALHAGNGATPRIDHAAIDAARAKLDEWKIKAIWRGLYRPYQIEELQYRATLALWELAQGGLDAVALERIAAECEAIESGPGGEHVAAGVVVQEGKNATRREWEYRCLCEGVRWALNAAELLLNERRRELTGGE